jgi:hypothetical protein
VNSGQPGAGGALAAPPGEAGQAAADARRNLRRIRNRILRFAVLVVLILGVPSVLESGHISAEWALAFGHATGVTATVTGSAPSAEVSRACGKTTINVVWADPAGFHHGSFTVCSDDADQFPAGKSVQVSVLSGDGSVIQGEGRGSAVSGVVIESLVVLGALLLLAGLGRQVFGLTLAGRRWAGAPWLPGTSLAGRATTRSVGQAVLFVPRAGVVPWTRPPVAGRRPRTALVRSLPDEAGYQAKEHGFDPDNALRLISWRRKDGHLLAPGDQVWLAAPRRSRGHRRAPYALIRAGDHRVFWAFGGPLPGDSNW